MSRDQASGSTLKVTLFDASGADREMQLQRDTEQGLKGNQLLWVDLDGRSGKQISKVAAALDLPDETARLLESDETAPRLLLHPKRIHARLVAMQPAEEAGGNDTRRRNGRASALSSAAIDILIARNVVVTVHEGSISAFEKFQESVRGDSQLGRLDAAGFLSVLVDAVLGVYLELVEEVERRIDALDELALRSGQASTFLQEVTSLRRRVAALRRTLAPHRSAFAPLARPDLEVPELGKPWPGVLERLERTIDAVENARELLIGSFDVYMARAAQRTNDVMKALTILSAILLPSAVLAGVMGMNFRLGFFDEPSNFWFAVASMLGLAAVVLGISRWRGWI